MTNVPDVADHEQPLAPGAIEPKVRAATIAATVSAFVSWALGAYLFHGTVPPPVQGAVDLIVVGSSTFAAGWSARHVHRKV